jgi:hypothetical protein
MVEGRLIVCLLREDVHSSTIAFQVRCALATDTPPPTAAAILWSTTPDH